MVGLCRFIRCFLLFATIGSVASYPGYVVAKVGQDALISLDINSGYTWHVDVINNYNYKKLFDQNLQPYGNNVARRITDLKRHAKGTISFILKNVTLQDAGTVVLHEPMNMVDLNILVVAARPEIEHITTTPAVVGKSMTLSCNARSRTQPPYHPLTLSFLWQTNWQPLSSDDHMTAGNLIIPNVSLEHQGDTYRCLAREDLGYNSSWSGKISLDVQYGPLGTTFHPPGDRITVTEKHDINVTCSSPCKPECDLELTLKGVITPKHRKGHVTIVTTAERSMTGSILCTARNKHGNTTGTRTLDILYSPKIQSLTGNDQKGNLEVSVGDSVQVEGVVDANPIPRVKLTGGNNRVVNLELGLINRNKYFFSLVLSNLTHQDHSTFTVTANNSFGSAQRTLQVKVKMAPTRIPSPIELHECGGSECWEFRILAFPKPTLEKIILFRPNKSSIQLYVKPTHTELKENLYEYTIEFGGPDYRGQYVFQFRNDVGVRNVTFDLSEANSQKVAPTRIPSPIELHECGGSECWEFRILAFPKPTLEKIILFRPNKSSIQLYVKPCHTELKENLHKCIMEFRGPDYRGHYVFQFRNDVGVRNVTFDLFEASSQEDTLPNFVIYVAVTCGFIIIIIIIITVSATVYCIKTYKNTEATVTEEINDSDVSNGYLTAVHETRTEDNVASDGEDCLRGRVMSPRIAGCGISEPIFPHLAPASPDMHYESIPSVQQLPQNADGDISHPLLPPPAPPTPDMHYDSIPPDQQSPRNTNFGISEPFLLPLAPPTLDMHYESIPPDQQSPLSAGFGISQALLPPLAPPTPDMDYISIPSVQQSPLSAGFGISQALLPTLAPPTPDMDYESRPSVKQSPLSAGFGISQALLPPLAPPTPDMDYESRPSVKQSPLSAGFGISQPLLPTLAPPTPDMDYESRPSVKQSPLSAGFGISQALLPPLAPPTPDMDYESRPSVKQSPLSAGFGISQPLLPTLAPPTPDMDYESRPSVQQSPLSAGFGISQALLPPLAPPTPDMDYESGPSVQNSPLNAGFGISQPLLRHPAPPAPDMDYETRPPLPQRCKLQQVKHSDSCA